MKYATETKQKKTYNMQPELIDSLPIEITENICKNLKVNAV
jgi:hypothetical protein